MKIDEQIIERDVELALTIFIHVHVLKKVLCETKLRRMMRKLNPVYTENYVETILAKLVVRGIVKFKLGRMKDRIVTYVMYIPDDHIGDLSSLYNQINSNTYMKTGGWL